MKKRNILFILLGLLGVFVLILFMCTGRVYYRDLYNSNVGIRVYSAILKEESTNKEQYNLYEDYIIKQLNEEDENSILQFVHHSRGPDYDRRDFYCMLEKNRVLKFITGEGHGFEGRKYTDALYLTGNINVQEIKLTREQYKEIINYVNSICNLSEPVKTIYPIDIDGGFFNVFYYKNEIYDFEICNQEEDKEKREEVMKNALALKELLMEYDDTVRKKAEQK